VRALHLAAGRLRLRTDHPRPDPAPGEALIRVTRSGICDTDLQLARGYMGFEGVPGHEFVGVVEAAPEPRWIGRRVVGEINAGCGRCPRCEAGDPRHCPDRTVLGIQGRDGAHAEYLTLPAGNLHAVPDDVPDEAAVFTEPLAAACRILEQRPVDDGEPVVVLGDGKLGLLAAAVLHDAGARVTLVGRHPEKRALVQALAGGVEATGHPVADGSAALVVDATGRAAGLAAALRAVRPEGTVVLKTTVAAEHRLDLAPAVVDEVTILGSRCGRFEPALALLRRLDPTPLIDEELPLARGVEAMAAAGRPGARKLLLRP